MTSKKKKSKKKELEEALSDALLAEGDIPPWHNAPKPSNYKFNKPDNGMEFDFAWPEYKVAVEISGGQWSAGKMGHNSGVGLERDARKGNWALLKGWLLTTLVTDHIEKEMETYSIPLIRAVLRKAGAPVKDYAATFEDWFANKPTHIFHIPVDNEEETNDRQKDG